MIRGKRRHWKVRRGERECGAVREPLLSFLAVWLRIAEAIGRIVPLRNTIKTAV